MNLQLQPSLQNILVSISPMQATDFEALYTVASDANIWKQHPNPDRYKRDVFANYFEGAIKSNGAFLVKDVATNAVIGSSRFYDYNAALRTVLIGYTFIACAYWGKGYNAALKDLMLQHAFQFVDAVHFHVGGNNVRSQMAMQNIGAVKIDELIVNYYGETAQLNYVYEIKKSNFSLTN